MKLPNMKCSDKSKVFMYSSLIFSAIFMTCFLVYILIVAKLPTRLSDADLISRDFIQYLHKYGKTYRGEEMKIRRKNFEESIKAIDFLNKPYSYMKPRFGLTKFSDMSVQEFESTMLMENWQPPCKVKSKNCFRHNNSQEQEQEEINTIPNKFDWRKYGVVGSVLDQKLCQNCWAFSAIGVMESMQLIRHYKKKPISNETQGYKRLSVQELTDCSKYTFKCNTSSVVKAVDFICNYHWPIVPEREYPLTLKKEDCKTGKPNEGVVIKKYNVGCDLSPIKIASIIVNHGPVAAAVSASSWQNYKGDVIKFHCSGLWENTNHVVQIVGYDMQAPVHFFIVRNSWGTNFGDNGYVYVAMNNFLCGIGRQITYFDTCYLKSSRTYKRKIQVDAAK